MQGNRIKLLPREEFDALKQEINRLAAEYVTCGKNILLREQIWLMLWKVSPNLFSHQKLFGFRRFSPSTLYENGMEFLTEVFSEAFPQVLNSYAAKNADLPVPRPFYSFFEACFIQKVLDAYGDILDHIPHDAIVVRKPFVQVYEQPREDAPIPDTYLQEGMDRRILGRTSDGKQAWIKTQLKKHGRTVYVREKDVECWDRPPVVDIDDATEQEGHGEPDEWAILSAIYDDYILSLLSLAGQFYARTQAKNPEAFDWSYGFQLLYTEKLLSRVKRVYNAVGDLSVQATHERGALSVAETGFLDYLLTDTCRTFSAIAVTPLHAKRDFEYLNSDSDEEIVIFYEDNKDKKKRKKKEKETEKEKEKEKCIDGIIYIHFLTEIKGIQGKSDSLAVSLSRHRKKFNKLYDEICGENAYFSRNGG